MAKAQFSDLPTFQYHPNPFSSGALVESEADCECCGQSRGYMYRGPIYSVDLIERVCPWCIADGSAAAKWNAEFTDGSFCDRDGNWIELPTEVYDEVFRRTPGVVGALQSVNWRVHCGRPAAFLRVEDERVRFRCVVCGKGCSYRDLE